jgi:transcriptional regulator with XRE-family HTH domain
VLSRLAAALMITTSLVLSGGDLGAAGQEQASALAVIDADTVGETLTALRRNRQMSRRALAQRADLRASTVARYETASTDPRILALQPIAAALGMQTEELVRAVELRQQQRGTDSDEWQSPADGVVFRVVASGANSRLWEWRLAPGAEYADESPWEVEEIATAIRGRVNVLSGEELHQLHRGGSVVLPPGAPRHFANAGTSTARLLRYRSVMDARSAT